MRWFGSIRQSVEGRPRREFEVARVDDPRGPIQFEVGSLVQQGIQPIGVYDPQEVVEGGVSREVRGNVPNLRQRDGHGRWRRGSGTGGHPHLRRRRGGLRNGRRLVVDGKLCKQDGTDAKDDARKEHSEQLDHGPLESRRARPEIPSKEPRL